MFAKNKAQLSLEFIFLIFFILLSASIFAFVLSSKKHPVISSDSFICVSKINAISSLSLSSFGALPSNCRKNLPYLSDFNYSPSNTLVISKKQHYLGD